MNGYRVQMNVEIELLESGKGLGFNLTAHGPSMSCYPKISRLYTACRVPLDIKNHKKVMAACIAETHFGVFKCPRCGGLHSVGVNKAWGFHVAPTRGELAQKR